MRKWVLIFTVGLTVFAAAMVAWFAWSAKQAPEFYVMVTTEVGDKEERRRQARQVVTAAETITRTSTEAEDEDRTWTQTFTQDQLNSWLIEEFPDLRKEWVPRGLQDPRVRLKSERVQVGFRLKSKDFDGIIALDLEPEFISPNRLEIEVRQIHAGLVPLPMEHVLSQFESELTLEGVEVVREVRDGRQVVIIQWPEPDPDDLRVTEVQLVDEAVVVSGRRPASDGKKTVRHQQKQSKDRSRRTRSQSSSEES